MEQALQLILSNGYAFNPSVHALPNKRPSLSFFYAHLTQLFDTFSTLFQTFSSRYDNLE